jgi:sugar/nucleoside kinase (ribokinase family)
MNGQPQLDVLVAGDLFLDLVMSGFPSWPCPGEEAFANKFFKEVGGGAAITACGLSKLGLHTGVLGSVGSDDGQWMLERLQARGVDTTRIRQTSTEPTAFTVSVSTGTDRTFLTYSGANRELPEILRDLPSVASRSQVRHVHLAHAMDLETAQPSFKAIAEKAQSLSLDVGWHPEWFADPRGIAALTEVDIFFPNQREGALITGETEPDRILRVLERIGLKRIALKLGAQGAALLWDGEIAFQKAGVIEPVDTTGAGDCFDAGFLYAWLRGMDPKLCLRAGAACGEMSARSLGGIAAFPAKEELEGILCSAK